MFQKRGFELDGGNKPVPTSLTTMTLRDFVHQYPKLAVVCGAVFMIAPLSLFSILIGLASKPSLASHFIFMALVLVAIGAIISLISIALFGPRGKLSVDKSKRLTGIDLSSLEIEQLTELLEFQKQMRNLHEVDRISRHMLARFGEEV